MKQVLLIAMMSALGASALMAQGRQEGRQGTAQSEQKTVITITEMSNVQAETDYLIKLKDSGLDDKFKVRLTHSDDFTKDLVSGWHAFEVEYNVAPVDPKTGDPVLMLDEVEITFALLYDGTHSKYFSSRMAAFQRERNKDKPVRVVGMERPDAIYSLVSETITYTTITSGRKHYAMAMVSPGAAAAYGLPIAFSVQIKVNGVQQGQIKTYAKWGNTLKGVLDPTANNKEGTLEELLGTPKQPKPWWENIENRSKKVVRRVGVLRDISQTPFCLKGVKYFDQPKLK